MKALAAVTLALALLEPACAEPDLQFSRAGSRPTVQVPAQNFSGEAHFEMLFTPTGPDRVSAGSVSFAPGARTAWHNHPLGQTLVVTAGEGRIQRWGGPIETIRPGDVVHIPPGVKHWHGAAPDKPMTHTAIQEALDGKTVDWMELVSDAQYRDVATDAVAANRPVSTTVQTSTAQRLMGDVAPKLAQLTDDVLFGDVWARPELSRRDRSLATVSTLIAMNRPDQLRSHVALARQNGLTETELVEVITQLAFYAGWPSAVTAVGVAREVFAKP